MFDNQTFLYLLAAATVVLTVVTLVLISRRRARWELVLDHVARTLKGRYTAGRTVSLAFIPGSVEAKIDGRSLSVGQDSVTLGSSGNTRKRPRMVIKIGTSQSKPEFLGPATLRPPEAAVTDYSGSGGNGEIEVGNQRVQKVKMSSKLRKRLAASATAADCLAELLVAGGVIEHGNVMLRSWKFEQDADRLMARVRNMSAVAQLVD